MTQLWPSGGWPTPSWPGPKRPGPGSKSPPGTWKLPELLSPRPARPLTLLRPATTRFREVELMVGVKKEMVKDAPDRAGLGMSSQWQFTQVRAPFPAVVVKPLPPGLGDFVSAGVPILSLYNPELLYVTANMEENAAYRGVAPGNPVELRLDAFDRPFTGRVVWINKSTGAPVRADATQRRLGGSSPRLFSVCRSGSGSRRTTAGRSYAPVYRPRWSSRMGTVMPPGPNRRQGHGARSSCDTTCRSPDRLLP